jgi:hypothetical protein
MVSNLLQVVNSLAKLNRLSAARLMRLVVRGLLQYHRAFCGIFRFEVGFVEFAMRLMRLTTVSNIVYRLISIINNERLFLNLVKIRSMDFVLIKYVRFVLERHIGL